MDRRDEDGPMPRSPGPAPRGAGAHCAVILGVLLLLPTAAADHIRDLDAEAPYACSGRDCIPAIDHPRFGDGAWLHEEDRVVGVVVDGVARAYPSRILNWHEIVNDQVGDRRFSVTYCPLCGSGIVFNGTLAGHTLTFGVSGRLFRNDLVMYDRQTGTLWSQLIATGVWGELHGRRLTILPSATTTWGEWRDAHPGSPVLARPDTYSTGQYSRYPYGDYERDGSTLQGRRHVDDRLPLKAWVFGVAVEEGAAAFLQQDLRAAGDATLELEGATIEARWDGVGPRAVVVRGNVTEEVPGVSAFWFAWADFHPASLIWPRDRVPSASEPPGAPGGRGIPAAGALPLLAAWALAAWGARR